MTIFDHHHDDLKRSGLTDGMIEAMGVYSLDANAIQRRVTGASAGSISDGYAIPYPGGQTVRYRLSTASQEGSGRDPVRYLSERGAAWGLYVPPGFDAVAEQEPGFLIITEGEKKAAKAVQEGVPCVGIAGVWMWRDPAKDKPARHDAGTPVLPDIASLAAGRRVCVLADSDGATNSKVAAAMKTLAKAIAHQVICAASIFRVIPESASGDKRGLDDWLCEPSGLADFWEFVGDGGCMIEGYERPGIRMAIPYDEAPSGGDLRYLIPYEVRGKPYLPKVFMEIPDDEGDLKLRPTKAPYLWMRRNLLVLPKGSDGEYRTDDSERPAQVITETEGVSDDRRRVIARFTAKDLTDKEALHNFGISGSPAEFQALARAQRNARMAPTVRVAAERGWLKVDGRLHYLYGDTAITPEGHQPVLPNISADAEGVKVASSLGDRDQWSSILRKLIETHPVQAAMIGFAASAAGLYFVPDAEPGVVHVYGDSSKGKTTTLQIAASLIGRATSPRDPSSWIRGWRTTDNGLERPLAETSHAPLMLDEIHSAPARTDWQATAYMIANGRGKERMKANTESRKTQTWELQVLSTGEVSMGEKIRSSTRGQIPGGLAFRLIDLYAGDIDLIKLRPEDMGDWAEIFGGEGPSTDGQLAEAIEDALARSYGHAWPDLIYALREDEGEKFRRVYEHYRTRSLRDLPENASSIAQRRTKHVAAAMAGIWVVIEAIGLSPKDDMPAVIEQTFVWAQAWFLTSGIEDLASTEAAGMVEQIQSEIMARQGQFQRPGGDISGRGYAPSLGWITEEGDVMMPVSKGWKALCSDAGIDPDRAKDAVQKEGWLKTRKRWPGTGRNGKPETVIAAPSMLAGSVEGLANAEGAGENADELYPV